MPEVFRPQLDTDEFSEVGDLFDLLTRRPAWMKDAACVEHPEVNFFIERGESSAPAKRVCAGCLCARECLSFAIATGDELAGVWGGTSPRERRAMRAGRAA